MALPPPTNKARPSPSYATAGTNLSETRFSRATTAFGVMLHLCANVRFSFSVAVGVITESVELNLYRWWPYLSYMDAKPPFHNESANDKKC